MSEARSEIVVGITADDETWEINITRDLKGSDWLAMERHRPDISYMSVVNAIVTKQVTVLALVLWAYRRHDEPDLTYESVLDSVAAADVGDFEISGTDKPDKKPAKATKGKAKESEGRPS